MEKPQRRNGQGWAGCRAASCAEPARRCRGPQTQGTRQGATQGPGLELLKLLKMGTRRKRKLIFETCPVREALGVRHCSYCRTAWR